MDVSIKTCHCGYWWLWVAVFVVSCNKHESIPLTDTSDFHGCANGTPVVFTQGEFVYDGTLDSVFGAAYFRANVSLDATWMVLETQNESTYALPFNAVVSVFSADGNQRFATVDDSPLWGSNDPFFFYHMPSTQREYCIKVETYRGWTKSVYGVQQSMQSLGYRFRLRTNPTSAVAYNTEIDQFPEQPIAVELSDESETDQRFGWIHGALDSKIDVDMFSFSTQSDDLFAEVYIATQPGSGNPLWALSGSGSTAALQLDLVSSEQQLLASVELGSQRQNIAAFLVPNQQYYLRVQGAESWQPGENDFYSLLFYQTPKSQLNFETTTNNDSTDMAGELILEEYATGFRYGSVWGEIGTEADVDVFYFQGFQEERLLLNCGAGTVGSGFSEFKVSVLDSNGALMQTQIEGAEEIEWSDTNIATAPLLVLPENGLFYLQVEEASQRVEEMTSHLYYCYISLVQI